MSRLRADVFLIIAALIWGTNFVVQKNATELMSPLFFIGCRYLISTLALAPFAWHEAKQSKFKLTKRDLGLGLLVGLCLFTASTGQQIGLTNTTVTNTGFLTSLYMAMVPFVARITMGTPLRLIIIVACAISLFGAWLLTGGVSGHFWTIGIICILGADLIWVFHILYISQFLQNTHRVYLLSFAQYGITTILAFTLCSIIGSPMNWHGLQDNIYGVLFSGLASGGIAFTLQVIAQRYTPAAEASLIMALESVFAALAGAYFLHERLVFSGIVGCTLILAGVVMVELAPLWRRKNCRQSL